MQGGWRGGIFFVYHGPGPEAGHVFGQYVPVAAFVFGFDVIQKFFIVFGPIIFYTQFFFIKIHINNTNMSKVNQKIILLLFIIRKQ